MYRRRSTTATLSLSISSIVLISGDLATTSRRLVHRRRRLVMSVSWRRRHVSSLAVLVAVLRRVLIHSEALRVVVRLAVCVLWLLSAHHPAVVLERREVFAQAASGVVVAADEVEENEGEEDGDYGVADCHAGL